MTSYKNRIQPDGSGITVVHAERFAQDGAAHRHTFCELALVLRGSCILHTTSMQTPLIAGDLVLFPPGQSHRIRPDSSTDIIYCQFEHTVSPRHCDSLLDRMLQNAETDADHAIAQRLRTLRAFTQETGTTIRGGYADALPAIPHGLLHLNPNEAAQIQKLLDTILQEQLDGAPDHIEMKRLLLDQLLILASRIAGHSHAPTEQQSTWQKTFISNAVAEIEQNFAQDIDFEALSRKGGITRSHFRLLFKKQTGLSPVDYLNRTRVARALELLQTTALPISEIALQVGIYDANYFTRLFKKITGYPPRYFKSIAH